MRFFKFVLLGLLVSALAYAQEPSNGQGGSDVKPDSEIGVAELFLRGCVISHHSSVFRDKSCEVANLEKMQLKVGTCSVVLHPLRDNWR